MIKDSIEIDWRWVRSELIRIERIPENNMQGQVNAILSCADECLNNLTTMVRPRCISREVPVKKTGIDFLELVTGENLSSRSLSSYLKDAVSVRVFLVTIGDAPEERASILMKEGEQLSGYLLDRLASISVESLAANYENHLRGLYASKGLSMSMRLSPGYCDWGLEEQKKIASIIDFSDAGVKLTGSCMMVPRKSISGVAGIGPKRLFSVLKSQCTICAKNDCDYRR